MLQQLPLIRNPAFKSPRAITLQTNYDKLLPTFQKSVPPKMNLEQSDLDAWLGTVHELQTTVTTMGSDEDPDAEKYTTWLHEKQRKVAPGFVFGGGVMQPKHRPQSPGTLGEDKKEMNELDKLFGRASIKEN